MKSIELFSGTGGLAKGLEYSGFQHASFVEFDRHACASLRENFDPRKIFEGDIRQYSTSGLGKIDLVAGGPPCQPFSLGGKHNADDDRRDMFPHAIRVIEELLPKAFIFENVKGLLRKSFSDYFEYIILRLTHPNVHFPSCNKWEDNLALLRHVEDADYTGAKYDVSFKLLNAADFGVPQVRERVMIVGIRSDLQRKWNFPVPNYSEERMIWDQFVTGEYWERHGMQPPAREDLAKSLRYKIARVETRYGLFAPNSKPWRTLRDGLVRVPDPRVDHSIVDHIFKDGARSYPGHTGSEIDRPAKTIKAGVHGVPGGENMIRFEDGSIRYLTVHEAKLLQTFPPDFKITGAWGEAMRQIGNAVPVTLAEQLGSSLAQLIRPTEDALQIPTDHKKNRNRTKIPQNSIQDFYAV
jgi:DNA (cytosine-5)-methyltransferase 1